LPSYRIKTLQLITSIGAKTGDEINKIRTVKFDGDKRTMTYNLSLTEHKGTIAAGAVQIKSNQIPNRLH